MHAALVLLFVASLASASAQSLADSVQASRVIGLITEAETGEPLIGTNVYLVGTTMGAATGVDGRYRIEGVPPGTHAVRVTYVGFYSVDAEVAVAEGRDAVLSVALTLDDDPFGCYACPAPIQARGPFFARVVTYEQGSDGCNAVEPGDTFTRDG